MNEECPTLNPIVSNQMKNIIQINLVVVPVGLDRQAGRDPEADIADAVGWELRTLSVTTPSTVVDGK